MAYKKGSSGSAGEANTASNVGAGGVGLYKSKTGFNLDFRNINAGSSKVTVSLDAPNNEVDIDVVVANLTGIAPAQITGTAVVTADLASASVLNATTWNGANKTVSTSAPTGGANGDIWFQYTP